MCERGFFTEHAHATTIEEETIEERTPPWQIAYFEVADSER